jgi:hypothetical protein
VHTVKAPVPLAQHGCACGSKLKAKKVGVAHVQHSSKVKKERRLRRKHTPLNKITALDGCRRDGKGASVASPRRIERK